MIYKKNGKVTTIVPTFNQQNEIIRALNSAIIQEGDFLHQVIVSSDGSTDDTLTMVSECRRKYPGLVVDLSGAYNVGISENFKRLIDAASGDYLAVLEGDDYWIDNKKLYKQIQFLRNNSDCAMVFSKIKIDNVSENSVGYLKRQQNIRKSKLTGRDFLDDANMNLIANFSCCLFRADLLKCAPEMLFSGRLSEIAVAFYLENFGPIGYIDEAMSVYVQHPKGVWTGSTREMQLRSGLETRKIVKEVARAEYKSEIQCIIEKNYEEPLASLSG